MTEREAVKVLERLVYTRGDNQATKAIALAISALQNEERLVEALEYFMDGCGCDGIEKCRYCENAKSALAKKWGER